MSESASAIEAVTAPELVGVWVFDPTDPDGTDRNFLFAEGRTESISVGATEIVIAGRANPLVEYGEQTIAGVVLTVFIPFGPEHDTEVDYWRTVADNRRALCYRDNRKRLVFGALKDDLAIADGRAGTAISVGLRRVDYPEAVA
jgi:hypothetical protein